MIMFMGLLGMLAAGATAFVGLGPLGADSEDLDEEMGSGPVPEDAQTGDGDHSGLIQMLEAAAETPDLSEPKGEDETGVLSTGEETDDAITGTDRDDALYGYDGGDIIDGLPGDDLIEGGLGEDTLIGGAGADSLHGDGGADDMRGGVGDDELYGHDDNDTLYGAAGDDSLVGSADDDWLHGGDGDDALHGGLDNDTLDGDAGADTLFGGWGNDLVLGARDGETDEDRDYLNGGGGEDTIVAGGGDIVTAGAGADAIVLGEWLTSGHQAEVLDFDAGEDRLMVVYDDSEDGKTPEVTLEEDADHPDRRNVLIDGVRVASVAQAQGLTSDHIVMMGETALAKLSALS